MAYIRTVTAVEADDDLGDSYAIASERSSLNAAKIQSLLPDLLAASTAFHGALMHDDSPLTRAEREMIAVVVSSANNCRYGVHSHANELRKEMENEELVTALQRDYRAARVDERIRGILDFAVLVTKDVHLVSKVNVQEMLYAGMTEEEVLAVVQVTCFINYENRLVDALGADKEDFMP